MLPGLVQRLELRLPPKYLDKLNATETVFSPITLPINLHDGRLSLDSFEVRTDTLRLSGQGQVGALDQSVAMQASVFIDPELSHAIIESVKELSALANASGEIEIPIAIQGRGPQIAVTPNLQYLATRVGVNTLINTLDQLLTPKSQTDPNAAPPAEGAVPPAGTQDQPAPTTEELIGGLLRKALKKHLPEESSATVPQ